ncbi:type 1 periplasmic binding fold superfamily protein [Polaribacter sp. Asnod1-A03]|uniref:type 1 periplasmic binding fold superfamily protein n=1 Tax=Polaribacter sp. Asnod1-A03 TaxID=3160581 RepID=UPI00386307EA
MKSFKHVLVLASIIILAASCSDDDPVVVNEEELITTVTVTLTSEEDGTEIVLNSVDLDGDGPDAPVVTVSGNLTANTIYTGVTEVFNETEDPAEDITEEVLEEGVDHQFFYTFANGLALTTYTDDDVNGDPIGITFALTTSNAGSESLTVSLIHEPNKSGSGVVDGSITNAAGETDAEVTFPITIE